MALFTLSVTDNTTLAGATVSGESQATIEVGVGQLPTNPIFSSVDINGGSIDGTPIGASSASTGAFTTLTASGVFTYDLSTISSSGDLAVADGGTGASDAATARTNLGLGSMATQADSSVDINGGSIDGTPIGASSASTGAFTSATISGDLTVDTDTLYVDSTNNRVGVGTTSPIKPLHVEGQAYASSDIFAGDQTSGTSYSGGLTLSNEVQASSSTNGAAVGHTLNVADGSNNRRAVFFLDDANGVYGLQATASSGIPEFAIQSGSNERMRIDSSGNLLVGKASANNTVVGVEAKANGNFSAVADGITPALIRRKTSDGDLIEFAKDGTTVGSIGVYNTGNRLFIGTGDTGLTFGHDVASGDAIFPMNPSTNTLRDNSIDLGVSSIRFDDIYATNGTIQTSDRNEKQDIAEIDEVEKRVAVACKGLICKYRWKDAVAEKGDAARIHVGVIAQDLQDAFAAEGLDAHDYAMFISATWWEHDGQIYETAEEAPEGAVEKTRLGVRYPELLAFIIGAL